MQFSRTKPYINKETSCTRATQPFYRASALALLLLVTALVGPPLAQADWDPPGPPPLDVKVKLETLELTEDQDDGLDGNAELWLTVSLYHKGHGKISKEFEEDLDWDWTHVWDIYFWLWAERECFPRSEISIATTLVEVDTSVVRTIAIAVVGATASAAVTALGGGTTAAVGIGVGIGAAGLAATIIDALNGNDDLGRNQIGYVPENWVEIVKSRGEDGGADIRFMGDTSEIVDYGQCDGDVTPTPTPTPLPEERTASIYNPLVYALAQIPSVEPEPGNPAKLDEKQVEDIRTTLRETTLGLAEAVAGAEIQDVAQLEGVGDAIYAFLSAQAERAVCNDEAALSAYTEAFLLAATARANDIATTPPLLLPFQLSITPCFMSTKQGAHVEILLVVLGLAPGQSVDMVTVTAQPVGLETNVIDRGWGVFTIEMEIGDLAPPGEYKVQFAAKAGTQQAQKVMTLIINATPAKTGRHWQFYE